MDEAANLVSVAVGQVFSVGAQVMQINAGFRHWADAPDNGPEGFGARLSRVLLFPR